MSNPVTVQVNPQFEEKAQRVAQRVVRLVTMLARAGHGFEIVVRGKGSALSTSYSVFEGPVE